MSVSFDDNSVDECVESAYVPYVSIDIFNAAVLVWDLLNTSA